MKKKQSASQDRPEDLEGYVRYARESLHRTPELSGRETETQEFLLSELRAFGFSAKKNGTGLIADIPGRGKKRLIALRADMDALPVFEENDTDYRSMREGVMHACGHDGHMAMLLGVAKLCAESPPNENVRLLFQPAEESGGGAERMIEAGALKNADLIFGLHVSPAFPEGVIATNAGAIFAGVCDYSVEFRGEGCHAAVKSQGKDALEAANAFYGRVYELFQRKYSGKNLFHIGKIDGGTAGNIVASSAKLFCTFRSFDESVIDDFMLRQEELLVDIFKSSGIDHRTVVSDVYPPLQNDPTIAELVMSGADNVVPCEPSFTAEDFAFYLREVPGCFSWLGVGNEEHTAPLHSAKFDFDSGALMTGVEFYKKIIYASRKAPAD